jgi:hypothetical protein
MTQPSDAELLQHHLPYEFAMLRDTYDAIRTHPDGTIKNALIESFCIHARALVEFFEKDDGARKYTDNGYSPGWDKTRIAHLVRTLNHQVALLLYGRTADPSQKLNRADQAELKTVLLDELTRFKAHLLPAYAGAPVALVIEPTDTPSSATNAIETTDPRTVALTGGNIWKTET